MDEMPPEIFLPVINWRAGENLVRALEKIGLTDIEIAGIRQIGFFKVIAPFEVRRERLQVRHLHFVVILLRIAQLHFCP